MNRNKLSIILAAFVFFFTSCADEDLGPVVTFDTAGKGAYVRLLEESNKLINLFDIAGSSYTYSVEFVDFERGALVAEYNLDLFYVDNTPENGDNSTGPIRIATFGQADFTDSPRGYRSLTDITFTANEIIEAVGLTADDLTAGDEFDFDGTLVLEDGSTFGNENSTAAVRGEAFQGHFDFTLPAACPSDLAGTFDYTSTDIWCDEPGPITGTVDIEAQGGGVYKFSDWAFGAYGPCYGGGTAGGDLTFTEVCAEVSFSGFTDSYGDTWTFESSIEGADWTIIWENTYGEAGTAVITHPSGEWPFTLKE